jgi:hypothetical protein
MSTRLVLLGTLLLLAGAVAHGALKAIEEAYELSPAQIIWPGSETGTLLVRRCAGCNPETLRVTPETQYFIRPAKTPVTLADARKAAGKAAGRSRASIFVYYDPRTRNVRRLVMDPA